ncbi:MAG: putative peptidoglycan glycosyltransferase FtsW [Lachnospiraceae bacterium]|nr:putative peptidoglycan glycosyltransferase FtsW [Lachnospiraceae bacterium]
MSKVKRKHYYDYGLLFTIIFLTIFGLVMIYSASSYTAQLQYGDPGYYMKRQGLFALIGFAAMIVISLIDYHKLLNFAIPAYIVSIALMIITMFAGREINGKRRWLGVGSLSFQPTEVVKIAIIVFMAVFIVNLGKKINTVKGFATVIILTLIPTALVANNNLSSGIIVFLIPAAMAFTVTEKKFIIAYIALFLMILMVMIFKRPAGLFLANSGILKPYQASRVLVWLEPEAHPLDGGYQVLQGLYAIGSGGFWGKGLGQSIQKLGFVPEAQNDMIFSIICEELGFVGALLVIVMFGFLIYRLFVLANSAPDKYGAFLCIGVMAHVAIQVILNIAVVSNVIPNTGVTLPFISYGGTSVVFLMCEMGLALSVSKKIYMDY